MKNPFILSSTCLFDISDKFFVSLCLFVLLFSPFLLSSVPWCDSLENPSGVCVCERERRVYLPSQQQCTLDHMYWIYTLSRSLQAINMADLCLWCVLSYKHICFWPPLCVFKWFLENLRCDFSWLVYVTFDVISLVPNWCLSDSMNLRSEGKCLSDVNAQWRRGWMVERVEFIGAEELCYLFIVSTLISPKSSLNIELLVLKEFNQKCWHKKILLRLFISNYSHLFKVYLTQNITEHLKD